jgi:hypothetical protein
LLLCNNTSVIEGTVDAGTSSDRRVYGFTA